MGPVKEEEQRKGSGGEYNPRMGSFVHIKQFRVWVKQEELRKKRRSRGKGDL